MNFLAFLHKSIILIVARQPFAPNIVLLLLSSHQNLFITARWKHAGAHYSSMKKMLVIWYIRKKTYVISTCVISNVLKTSLTDTEKCMCWFFASCCINLVAMLTARVYFERKEYNSNFNDKIHVVQISKCTLVSMFIVSLCFDIVNPMLILVIVFAWFTLSLAFRCVICWFDFHFTTIYRIKFFNIVFRMMMLIFFLFITWTKWFF